MAIPKKAIALVAAAGGLAYLLLGSKNANAKPAAAGAGAKPDTGGGSVTIPPDVLPTVPGVNTIHVPQVTITPPGDNILGPGGTQTGGTQTPPDFTLPKPSTGGSTVTVPTPAGNLTLPSNVTIPTPAGNVNVSIPAVIPTATTTPTVTAPTTNVVVPPLIHEETQPDQDPFGTVALAQKMIAIEPSANWKTAFADEIRTWQSRKKLTVDGKFGRESQLAMGQEVGILPVIRYWPKTLGKEQLPAALEKQRQALHALAKTFAASNPAHAKALDLSASYEAGQGFPVKPAGLDPQGRVWQANQLKAALGGS